MDKKEVAGARPQVKIPNKDCINSSKKNKRKEEKALIKKKKELKSQEIEQSAMLSAKESQKQDIVPLLDKSNMPNLDDNSSNTKSIPSPLEKETKRIKRELALKINEVKDKYKQLKKLMNFTAKDKYVDSSKRDLFDSGKQAVAQQKNFLAEIWNQKNNPNTQSNRLENEYKQINEYLAENVQREKMLDEMIKKHRGVISKEKSDKERIAHKTGKTKDINKEVNGIIDINAYNGNEYTMFSPENHRNRNDIDPIKPQTPFCFTQGEDNAKGINNLTQISGQEISKLPEESKECFICLIDFMTDNSATFLPCRHIFHSACIKDRFKKDQSCPICKHKIEGDTDNNAQEP